MSCERLTERQDDGTVKYIGGDNDTLATAYEKLKYCLCKLEDKIEDGRLVELPIPLGTELHFLHSHEHADRPIFPTIHSTNKWSFEIWGNGKSGISSDDIPCGYYGVYRHKLGDTVFLTSAEAEAKLEELRGE